MLFPLPFTPFEYYYWCDDSPASPTTFPIELEFRGELDRDSLEEALQYVMVRHPLLHALVDAHSTRLPQWINGDSSATSIDWGAISEPIRPSPISFLDLTSRPGLRIWGRTSPEQSRMVLQFHHACCDALGALQFIKELLIAYDSRVKGLPVDARLQPLDPQRLRKRGDYGLSESNYRPGLRDALTTARIWGSTLCRRPILLAGSEQLADVEPAASECRPYLTEPLSQDVMQQLQTVASRAHATVNDLMLRDLFIVLVHWNAERGAGTHQRLTVNVPVSLRSKSDSKMPAANSLGFWFLHRSATECSQPVTLLDSLGQETKAVKKWRMPLYFIGGLKIAAAVPGLMPTMLARKQSFATAVFSNVGRVFARTPLEQRDQKLVCGNVILDRLTGVPPIRPGTRAAFVIVTYGGETTINLRTDPKVFSSADTRQLLTAFRDQLLQSAAS